MTAAAYLHALRTLALRLPGCRIRFTADDRNLAAELHRRGTDFNLVHGALLVATARRLFRDPELPPLSPIRSLRYFMPIIDELQQQPLPSGYLAYLESKLSLRPCPPPHSPPGAGSKNRVCG